MPGRGKSGTLRMACCNSAGLTLLWSISDRLLFYGLKFFDHFTELIQGNILNLAHALAGNAEFLANLFESFLAPAVQAETVTQDGGFAWVQRFDHLLQHLGNSLFFEVFVRGIGILVLHDLGKIV